MGIIISLVVSSIVYTVIVLFIRKKYSLELRLFVPNYYYDDTSKTFIGAFIFVTSFIIIALLLMKNNASLF